MITGEENNGSRLIAAVVIHQSGKHLKVKDVWTKKEIVIDECKSGNYKPGDMLVIDIDSQLVVEKLVKNAC
ncbi:hypothetical protein ACQ3MN_07860 [Enterococcus faecalis]|uniref:hypothetical protein n=1 Tax=Enterococcus faecalis TaxID=1351 RepID=UPI003D779924